MLLAKTACHLERRIAILEMCWTRKRRTAVRVTPARQRAAKTRAEEREEVPSLSLGKACQQALMGLSDINLPQKGVETRVGDSNDREQQDLPSDESASRSYRRLSLPSEQHEMTSLLPVYLASSLPPFPKPRSRSAL